MIHNSKLLRRAAATAALGFAIMGGALIPAATFAATDFSANLSGAAEVPPVSSPGSGMYVASLDTGTKVLTWTLTHSGLTGPASAAHLHGPAMPGANAGVVIPFSSAVSGSTGKVTLTDAQIADLMAGKWYANVHTAAHPGGEIRGQVMTK